MCATRAQFTVKGILDEFEMHIHDDDNDNNNNTVDPLLTSTVLAKKIGIHTCTIKSEITHLRERSRVGQHRGKRSHAVTPTSWVLSCYVSQLVGRWIEGRSHKETRQVGREKAKFNTHTQVGADPINILLERTRRHKATLFLNCSFELFYFCSVFF